MHKPVKGKIMLSALRTPYLDHIITDQESFQRTCLRLILSDYLSPKGLENLNKTSKSFTHFHRMLIHVEPSIIWKLFQFHHDPEFAS